MYVLYVNTVLTYTDVWSGVQDADYVGVLEVWADKQPCTVKGRGKRSLMPRLGAPAPSSFCCPR